MSSKAKIGKWINDNIVMLVGIPLIIGIHYGWSKLQDVPYLVDQSEKKTELPILTAITSIKGKLTEKFSSNSSAPSKEQEN